MNAKQWKLVVLFFAICAQVLLRMHTIDEPLDCDEAIYGYIAHRIQLGDRMYADVFENKPPGTFAIYLFAVWYRGFNEGAIRWIAFPFVLTTLFLLWRIAARTLGSMGAIAAASLFAFTAADPFLFADSSNLEVFLNLFLSAAMLFAIADSQAPNSGMSTRLRWLGAGLSLGCATLVKQNTVLHLVLLFIWAYRNSHTSQSRAQKRVHSHWWLLFGFVAAWGAALGWICSQGVFTEFLSTLQYGLTMTRDAASRGSLSQLFLGKEGGAWWGHGIWPIMVLAAMETLITLGTLRFRTWSGLFALWTFVGFAEIAWTGMYWQHYYLLLLPGMVLLSASFLHRICAQWKGAIRIVSVCLAAIGVALLIWLQWVHYIRLSSEEIMAQNKSGQQWVDLRKIGLGLQEAHCWDAPQPRLLIWGWQTPLLVYSGFDSVTPYFFTDPLMTAYVDRPHPDVDLRKNRIVEDLKRHLPEIVSVGEKPFPEMLMFLQERYTPVSSRAEVNMHEGRGLYYRTDVYEGMLEKRRREHR